MIFKLIPACLFLIKNFPKLSSPSRNYLHLQPPPVRRLSRNPLAQMKVILAWGI